MLKAETETMFVKQHAPNGSSGVTVSRSRSQGGHSLFDLKRLDPSLHNTGIYEHCTLYIKSNVNVSVWSMLLDKCTDKQIHRP